MQQVFRGAHTIDPSPERIYGVLSLIFWSLTIVVTIKYVLFIMRADNGGEGGIMALISLVQRTQKRTRATTLLVLLGIFGASLFYGDGMITPAISVLSAVEGVGVAAPGVKDLVVPIALAILTMLFVVQRRGTGVVGRLFGPVMLVWFSAIATLGITEIVGHPSVLRSLSPTYAVSFFIDHPGIAFLALGSVVLAVTGAEALYADMGHFGRPAISRAWLLIALPALVCNYMGQGALLVSDSGAADNPFFRLGPTWAQIPLVILATFATVVASQAVISGAFSVSRQAVQLGFLPRLTVRHTSSTEQGQIYVPAVNWLLFAAVVALVLGFRSSAHLASAYGIAVTGTLAIDTILAFVVVRTHWRKPLWVVICGATALLVVDLAFFSANLTKVFHGGWFPIVIGLLVFSVLSTWWAGRRLALRRLAERETPLADFLAMVASSPPVRIPGTAVFLTAIDGGTPLPLNRNLEHNHVLHEQIILVTSNTKNVPHVEGDDRLAVTDLGHGIWRVVASYGFQDDPDVPAALQLAATRGLDIDEAGASYFVSHITLNPTHAPGMALWRKRLFSLLSRNSMRASSFLGIPSEQVIEVGTQVDI
jgi:KUP system potassium uptake protein